jgi:hypothetical protein
VSACRCRCQVTTSVPVKHLHVDSAFYSCILLNVCMPSSTGAVQVFLCTYPGMLLLYSSGHRTSYFLKRVQNRDRHKSYFVTYQDFVSH